MVTASLELQHPVSNGLGSFGQPWRLDSVDARTTYTVGDDVEVDYGGDLGWVKGQVVGVQEDGLYEVEHPQWDEGSRLQQDVEASDMRALE